MEQDQLWTTMNGDRISRSISDEVRQALLRETALGHEFKVCIGTDSQVTKRTTGFATVIVFVRKGKGGFLYTCNESTKQKMSLKERMMAEVAKSVSVAYSLCDLLAQQNVQMEVHADINTSAQFKSNIALKDAMGYITGMGFAFKAKPQAFASSCCANKMVR